MSDTPEGLAMEFVSAGVHDGDASEAFQMYMMEQLTPHLGNKEFMSDLVSLLATISSISICQWAEDTHREPAELVQTIALAHAST